MEPPPARSTFGSSLSPAPRLLKHPVSTQHETARADQDITPGITGPPSRDIDTAPALGSPDASYNPFPALASKRRDVTFCANCEMDHIGPRPTRAFYSSPGGASRFQCPGRARPHRRHTPPAALFF